MDVTVHLYTKWVETDTVLNGEVWKRFPLITEIQVKLLDAHVQNYVTICNENVEHKKKTKKKTRREEKGRRRNGKKQKRERLRLLCQY